MRALILLTAVSGIALVGAFDSTAADKKPKFTTKAVMKKCMKEGLCKKAATGKASAEEQKLLIAMFTALGQNKPPKGGAESWKTKTAALVAAAKSVAEGDEGAGAKLAKAADCKACHSVHKPPKKK